MKSKLLRVTIMGLKYISYALLIQLLFLNMAIAGTAIGQKAVSVRKVEIALDVKNSTVLHLFKVIESKTDFKFSLDRTELKPELRTTISISNQKIKVSDVLIEVSKKCGLRFMQVNNTINVKKIEKSKADDREDTIQVIELLDVSGKVIDETGEGLPGVSVLEKGTTNGTVTDIDGNYSLSVQSGAILVFSFVGYATQEIFVGDQSIIDISMESDIALLSEIVVVGYGTQKRSDVTGSVASANIDAFRDQPNVSIIQSLQGTVAGLNVGAVTNAGENPSLSVRGRNTFARDENGQLIGNDPLIVLDGIIYRGSLIDINPSDVASVDVLKDASSQAIYGSQAANGVILITTKTGKKEKKPVFNFSTAYTMQTPSSNLTPLNRQEYLDRNANIYGYLSDDINDPGFTQRDPDFDPRTSFTIPAIIEGFDDGTDTDWLDLATQNASLYNANVSMAGSTEATSYFISAGYTDQKGYLRNDTYNRVNLRANFETDITDWFSLGMQSFVSAGDYSGQAANLRNATIFSPLVKPYDEEGNLIPFPMDGSDPNPLIGLEVDNLDKRLNLSGTFYGEVRVPFIEGLSYRLNVSTNHRTRRFYNFNRFEQSGQGSARKFHDFNRDRTIDNIITYSRRFNDIHDVNVTLLYGHENRIGDNTDARAGTFLNPVLGYNSLEGGDNDRRDVRSGAYEENALYQLGRLNYQLKDKYLITLSVRRDGFSGFGTNNKFGTFPSAAVGWVLSNEDFFANFASKIDNLKLRASYGSSGNRSVGRYQTLARVNAGFEYVFGDRSAFGQRIAELANDDLGWETTTGLNLGLDFGIFDNRITGEVNYYDTKTEGILVNIALPRVSNFADITSNIGEVENHGLEITLSSVNMKVNDFTWKSTVIFSRNRNQIASIRGVDNDGDGVEDDDISSSLFIGESIRAIYGYTIDGIYQVGDEIPDGFQPGNYIIRDQNSDNEITPLDDRTILGYAEEDYRFSILNELTYKRFGLGIFINSIQGGKDFYKAFNEPVLTEAAWGSGVIQNFNSVKEFDFWTPANTGAQYAGVRNTTQRDPRQLQQRSFVRLQDVNLSYSLPENLLRKYGVNNARVFFSAKNLITLTDWEGVDPETGAGFATWASPVMRSYSLGLNMTF